MYLPVKSGNFHYVPLSTAKRVKLEIVLSLTGHVGSNPTISANKKHRLRLVLFCISNRIFPAFQKYVSMVVVQDFLKRIRKPDILLLRPLWAPLGVLSGTEELFVFITP